LDSLKKLYHMTGTDSKFGGFEVGKGNESVEDGE
jgi:hypothetical protein